MRALEPGARRCGTLSTASFWSPLVARQKSIGNAEHSWSVDFRVADLDAMVRQLRDSEITVDVDPEHYPNGRFANLHDPKGNPSNCGNRPVLTSMARPDPLGRGSICGTGFMDRLGLVSEGGMLR